MNGVESKVEKASVTWRSWAVTAAVIIAFFLGRYSSHFESSLTNQGASLQEGAKKSSNSDVMSREAFRML